jgi:phage terminase large subunit
VPTSATTSRPTWATTSTPSTVGERTDFPDRFANLKAQLYWSLRETFQEGAIYGIDDELMISQLASLRYELTPRGLIAIEKKEAAARRGVKSPDRAEALMLAFAARAPGSRYIVEELVL